MKKETKEEIYLAPQTIEINKSAISDTLTNDIKILESEKSSDTVANMMELTDLRESNRKIYQINNEYKQAVFYPEAIHVLNKKTNFFENVNNHIVPEEDGRYFVCEKSNFIAKFSREKENDELFSIKSGMHRVVVYIKKPHKDTTPIMCNIMPAADTSVCTDTVGFKEVSIGTDYEYSVETSGIKENIVIKEKANIYRYMFILKCENVTVHFEEAKNRIAFLSNENGEEVFYIPAPFMSDANNNISNDVFYEINSSTNGETILTVTADSNWINEQGRNMPVIIDPQIKLAGNGNITSFNWSNGYISKPSTHVLGITNDCNTRTEKRMYFKITKPTLPGNPRIKKAEIQLTVSSGYNNSGSICNLGLYNVLGDIFTGNCDPETEDTILDYTGLGYTIEKNKKITFDITNSLDKLCNGEVSFINLMLKYMIPTPHSNISFYGDSSNNTAPTLNIVYSSDYGVNDSYSYSSHRIGNVGFGNVNLECGNLMFECQDFVWEGNRLPVTIKHLYNSSISDYQYTNNPDIKLVTSDFSSMNIGKGWKLNVMQSMVYDSSINKYIYVDENGNETYFSLSDKKTECNDNSQCYPLYEADDRNEVYYDDRQRTITMGEKQYTFNESGQLIKISANNSILKINYTSGRISSVTDGAGRNFGFIYDSYGHLISITAPDYSSQNQNAIMYSYKDNLLTDIVYQDGKSIEIFYTSNKPSKVTIKDKTSKPIYKIEYTFSGKKVASITEFGATDTEYIKGTETSYSYSAAANRTTAVSTEPGDPDLGETEEKTTTTVYSFDNNGDLIGQYTYTETPSSDNAGEKSVVNVYSSSGAIANNIDNLLLNHNFNGLENWSSEVSANELVKISNFTNESYAKFGKKLLRVENNDSNCSNGGVYQNTITLPAGEYAFSAYVRPLSDHSGNSNPGAYIKITNSGGNVLAESEHINKKSSEYIRLVVPFKIATPQSVRVHLLVSGTGISHFDGVQLEKNSYANSYNMIINPNFEHALTGWNSSEGVSINSDESFNMNNSLKLIGNLFNQRYASQIIPVKSNKGIRETFTLSGWAKGNSLPYNERENCNPAEFSLSALIEYSDSTTEVHTAYFSPNTTEWQLTQLQFAKQEYKQISKFTIFCNYNYNVGYAIFDDICLFRNSIENGLSETNFASSEIDTESLVVETTAKPFEEATDNYGNAITETSFADGKFGTMYRSYEYNSDCNSSINAGNDLIGETDTRGNKTSYVVDEDTSKREEIIDRCGNKTIYEYDITGKKSKVTKQSSCGTELSNISYKYNEFDNLTEIIRGDGAKYTFKYNAFHILESIGVDDDSQNNDPQNLITYKHKNGNGKIKEVNYANGNTMKATYDKSGNLIAEKWFSSKTSTSPAAYYRYIYDNLENIVKIIDINNNKEYSYTYEEGIIVRSAEYNILFDENLNVTEKHIIYSIDYTYNSKRLLSKKIVSLGTKRLIYFLEYPENCEPVVKLAIGDYDYVSDDLIENHYEVDNFGRKTFDEVRFSNGFLSRQFKYHDGRITPEHRKNYKFKSAPTTNLVSEITYSNGRTISYEYDAEDRITRVSDSAIGVSEYVYDNLGQITFEKFRGSTIKTVTYDNYGNITSLNGTDYTYDTGKWKDRLICYGGQPIPYDNQGNPTNYMGRNLTWEKGRQLKSCGNTQYTYNSNGIRTSKTVNGVKHIYTLDGTKILREEFCGNELIPLYNNEGKVYGIIYNDSRYFFLRNLQGDIIAITDRNGDVVAEYFYSAWGTFRILSDNTDCHIATINPFRYRGYYYDNETGFYYLQSRYYDPYLGRFLNADSPEFVAMSGENLYAYCGNCLTKNIDTSGFCYVPSYPSSSRPKNNRPSLSSVRSKSWLLRFIEKLVSVQYSSEQIVLFCPFNAYIGGVICSYIVEVSSSSNSFITLGFNKDDFSVSLNTGALSVKRSLASVTTTVSFSKFSSTIQAYYKRDPFYIEYGICVLQNTIADGVKTSVGFQISVRISYLAILAIESLLLAAILLFPAIAPIAAQIGKTCAQFAASAVAALPTLAGAFVPLMYAVAR